MLVRSLRWVPPTAPLLQARTTKRLITFGLSAHRSFGREDDRTNRRKKKVALYPRPERQGFTARTGKCRSTSTRHRRRGRGDAPAARRGVWWNSWASGRGLLEAAIFRPQSGYHDDLIHEAAALMESLANNHAFLDGNKRISFAATDTFLRVNGHYLEVEPFAAHRFITASIGRGEFRIRQIREWLSAHVKRL